MEFKIDPYRLTLNDLITLEEKTFTHRETRDFLARFLVDEAGQPIAFPEAQRMVGELNITQLNEAAEKFRTAVQELQSSSIPPEQAAV